jgi:hypothetical protein
MTEKPADVEFVPREALAATTTDPVPFSRALASSGKRRACRGYPLQDRQRMASNLSQYKAIFFKAVQPGRSSQKLWWPGRIDQVVGFGISSTTANARESCWSSPAPTG